MLRAAAIAFALVAALLLGVKGQDDNCQKPTLFRCCHFQAGCETSSCGVDASICWFLARRGLLGAIGTLNIIGSRPEQGFLLDGSWVPCNASRIMFEPQESAGAEERPPFLKFCMNLPGNYRINGRLPDGMSASELESFPTVAPQETYSPPSQSDPVAAGAPPAQPDRPDANDAFNTRPANSPPPTVQYQPPPTGYKPPSTGYQPPPTGYQIPPTGYKSPPIGYQPPPTGYKPPSTGYQPSPTGYKAPPTGYQVPAISAPGYKAPTSVYPQTPTYLTYSPPKQQYRLVPVSSQQQQSFVLSPTGATDPLRFVLSAVGR